MLDPTTEEFFTDKPLIDHAAEERWASWKWLERWSGHTIVIVSGHAVWKPEEEWRPEDGHCFYCGDYRDVLAPDDPRVQIPSEYCDPPLPVTLDWDE